MKIKFLAVGVGPDFYDFVGDKVIVWKGGESAEYDFTAMNDGDHAELAMALGCKPIRGAEKSNGEVSLILCQRVGAGNWTEGDWMDSADYDPNGVHVSFLGSGSHPGAALVLTAAGLVDMNKGTLLA